VPVAEVTSRILQVREARAGSSVGYHGAYTMTADGRVGIMHGGFDHGLHGDLAGNLFPLVHGRTVPLIGRPALSQALLDVSAVSAADVGSEVLLAGEARNMHDVARGMGRGTWELLLPLLRNARREYH